MCPSGLKDGNGCRAAEGAAVSNQRVSMTAKGACCYSEDDDDDDDGELVVPAVVPLQGDADDHGDGDEDKYDANDGDDDDDGCDDNDDAGQ